jgi:nitronate monooxygenase
MDFGGEKTKAWKDIWGCGQGIGAINKVLSTADMVAQFKREFAEAKARMMRY